MLSSITLLGQQGRKPAWLRAVAGFWLGAAIAGAFLFGLLGLVGEGIGLAERSVWAVPVLIGLSVVLDLTRFRPPGPRRQVNEDWLGRYRDWVTGIGFGFQLGGGLFTYVTVWGVWAVGASALALGFPAGSLLGLCFGAGRALLVLGGRRVDRPERLAARMREMAGREQLAARGTLALSAALVVIGAISAG